MQIIVRVQAEGCNVETFPVTFISPEEFNDENLCLMALGTLFRQGYCPGDAYQIVKISDGEEVILEGTEFPEEE